MAHVVEEEMQGDSEDEPKQGHQAKSLKVDPQEIEAKKRQAILSSVTDPGLRMFMEWSFEATDKASASHTQSDSKITDLSSKVDKQSSQITGLQTQQEAFESRLLALESQQRSDAASSVDGLSTAPSLPGTPGASRNTRIPVYVELYGWVQDWSSYITASKTMIGDEEAMKLLLNAIELVRKKDEAVHARIDVDASKRLVKSKPMTASVRIRFKKGTSSDVLFQANTYLCEIQDDQTRRGAFFTSMLEPLSRLRVRVDAPPWKVPHNQAIGRFYGEWAKIHPTIYLRGTTGSGKTPSTMWSDAVQGRRSQIAEFHASEFGGNGQWKIIPEVWAEFKTRHGISQTPAEIEAVVATRTQRSA